MEPFCKFGGNRSRHRWISKKNARDILNFSEKKCNTHTVLAGRLQKPSVFQGFSMPKCNTHTLLACRPPKTFSFCMFLNTKVQHSHDFSRSISKNLQFLTVFQCQSATLTRIWQVDLQKPTVFNSFPMPKCNPHTILTGRPAKFVWVLHLGIGKLSKT